MHASIHQTEVDNHVKFMQLQPPKVPTLPNKGLSAMQLQVTGTNLPKPHNAMVSIVASGAMHGSIGF